MCRYILRYQGQGAKPQDDVQRFRALSGVKLIDESSRMLLVEAPCVESLQAAVESAGCWSISDERSVELPPIHPNLDKPRPKPKP
jgi:hypothetical protein